MELERVSAGPNSAALPGADVVATPLGWQEWDKELRVHLLVRGLCFGFRLGHEQSKVELAECKGNMYEASQHETIISAYLEAEERANRIWRVSSMDGAKLIQCSPFGVIPKKGKPGKWRLIVNLSAPDGRSVNDGVDRTLSSVAYTSVDEVVRRVLLLGRGAEVAKADVRVAYRNVPVHPEDRWLLGMRWKDKVFVDGALPFGLRSAPLLFTALGDTVEWVATQKGATWLRHYIDNFVTVGKAGTDECARFMDAFKVVCRILGMPLDEKKEEGPAMVITFLDMEVDTLKMEVRLPQEKLGKLRKLLKAWRGMKCCRKRDLDSILGLLNHACNVVRAGRSFKRRLQDLSMSVRREDRRARLNVEARADLEWWWQFGLRWNGTAMMHAVVEAEQP